jgi:hypothetical protein
VRDTDKKKLNMEFIYLKETASGTYIRVMEDCITRKNLGLISRSRGEFWLWVKRDYSKSSVMLYLPKDRSAFSAYKKNLESTPCGGTGYLGGRKFSSLKSIEIYLGRLAQVKWC